MPIDKLKNKKHIVIHPIKDLTLLLLKYPSKCMQSIFINEPTNFDKTLLKQYFRKTAAACYVIHNIDMDLLLDCM